MGETHDKAGVKTQPSYTRVLLKISGEALMGQTDHGIDHGTVHRIANEIIAVRDLGIEVAVVVGGGNIWRGLRGTKQGIEQVTSDHMGMLATVMNALALQSELETLGAQARVMSAIPLDTMCEPYIRRRGVHHLQKGRILICAAGTGNPYFTTDSGAALRAAELGCQVLMKGTKVDGVYDKDPMKHDDAKFYDMLSFKQVLNDHLQVMDATAIALSRESRIPILVFSIEMPGAFVNVLKGEGRYTLIQS